MGKTIWLKIDINQTNPSNSELHFIDWLEQIWKRKFQNIKP